MLKQQRMNELLLQDHVPQDNNIDDSTNPKKNVIQTLRKAGILENEIQNGINNYQPMNKLFICMVQNQSYLVYQLHVHNFKIKHGISRTNG